MALVTRAIQHTLSRRLAENAPLIQVLVGPRQVGKTTAIMGALAGRGVYQSADSPVPLRGSVLVATEGCMTQPAAFLLPEDHPQAVLAQYTTGPCAGKGWS